MKYLSRLILLVACLAAAQTPQAASSPTPAKPKADVPVKMASLAPLVTQQFGPTFTPAPMPTVGAYTADFDGDGVEDVVFIADSKDPLPDSYQFKYTVSDPYHSFFGFGDPRHTAGLGAADPGHNHDLLVIFGAGPEAWRSATPKAKFVLINVPFDTIAIGRMLAKKNKPPIFTIHAQESRLMDSVVFYDAKKKKWKWQPGDTLE